MSIGLSVAALVVCIALSLALGARDVSLSDVWDGLTDPSNTAISAIAVRERIPRTVLALLAGAALGLSGALMQALTRNPLADPGILGVNMGAALFVVAGIAYLGISTLTQYLWLALLGAALAAAFVYAVGAVGRGGPTPIKLALAGAAISAALSSLVSAILLPRLEVMTVFRFWQVGGVSGAEWSAMEQVAPFLLLSAALGFAVAGPLNALALGDEVAAGLGVRVGLTRLLAAIAGVVLCGAVTAVAGPIAFVGLMVPHAVRLLIGPDQRWVLPLSAVGGAVLLTLADVIGRLAGRAVGGGELEAGIVTVIIGAPVLIAIARSSKVREL
ncbi:FecCD family ABC transporter permease [Microbacterium terricola]|uniref:Iron ABC transporter n=1 Tax=Microbacterium terricola TaxID=344163 RepID=A0ABM8DZ27_9MICO|nr:iron chelate uptake ABC transporter family permease subunit [Microbacterium terricola]UYK41367.1 iron chelate uptake ABC transporter family permease subunit [Microbacterium terricola]BDV30849.1 iron ABC transporter [Microbacterium terricola]